MTKKQTTTKKPAPPLATIDQLERIEELGQKLYQNDWDKEKIEIYAIPMTPNRARQLIYEFHKILGGNV